MSDTHDINNKSENDEMDMDYDSDSDNNDGVAKKSEVFNPKKHKLDDEMELEMDESSYVLYHTLKVEHSCLSFDIVSDNCGSGESRAETFPYTTYAVTGSQASAGHSNILTVMKMSNLNQLKKKENDDDESEDDEEESEEEFLDEKTELTYVNVLHNGAVNRVRSTNINGNTMVASWSDMGQVHVWDMRNQLWAVNDAAYMAEYHARGDLIKPVYSVRNHKTEGFAIDWSRCKPGQLASGDNDGAICITLPHEHGFQTIAKSLSHHQSSVEDLQWSPNQENIVISCSSDRSIVVWDIRDMKHHVDVADAHSSDINVISWSPNCAFSLVSGGDDGLVKVWDMRMFRSQGSGAPMQQSYTHLYDYHKDCPITSIEWCPHSQYVFACSSEDDQLTLWDISMEQDGCEEGSGAQDTDEYPVHLLFNHMGQKEIKELHWHPQIPGLLMSTALDGINIFKTISV